MPRFDLPRRGAQLISRKALLEIGFLMVLTAVLSISYGELFASRKIYPREHTRKWRMSHQECLATKVRKQAVLCSVCVKLVLGSMVIAYVPCLH